MSGSIEDIPKRRGPKPSGGRKLGIMVRLPPEHVAILDRWIAAQPDPKPSRPEAIRRLMEKGLGEHTGSTVPEGSAVESDPAVCATAELLS
jgi:hypothetical protein